MEETFMPSLHSHSVLRFPVRRVCCRRWYPLQRESNPLFRAVLTDDLEELKSMVQQGASVNIQNAKGNSLLNFAIRRKRVEIFDYLLSLDEIDLNYHDRLAQSPLIYLAAVCFDEYFALELIRKGGNIHVADDCGFTFLHLLAKAEGEDSTNVGRVVIEKGADVNARAKYGLTPLYCACEAGNFDWVCMLLYYGADATISRERGVLPVAAVSQDLPQEELLQLQEILFEYTFSEGDSVRLPTLVMAMVSGSDLFVRILNTVACIEYDKSDLQYMLVYLIYFKPKHVKVLIERCSYIVEELLSFPLLNYLVTQLSDCNPIDVKNILDAFLESDYVAEFVQKSVSHSPIIGDLTQTFSGSELIQKEEIFESFYVMLSYGLEVTSVDLDKIYNTYGDCEFFRNLLHMDVFINLYNLDVTPTMAYLCYHPEHSLAEALERSMPSLDLIQYFNNSKLRETLNVPEGKECHIPSLVELSRNVLRLEITNKLKIKNCAQFYNVVKKLPIGEMNQKIITLDRKLYQGSENN